MNEVDLRGRLIAATGAPATWVVPKDQRDNRDVNLLFPHRQSSSYLTHVLASQTNPSSQSPLQ